MHNFKVNVDIGQTEVTNYLFNYVFWIQTGHLGFFYFVVLETEMHPF